MRKDRAGKQERHNERGSPRAERRYKFIAVKQALQRRKIMKYTRNRQVFPFEQLNVHINDSRIHRQGYKKRKQVEKYTQRHRVKAVFKPE
jgi:hypothetical protein